MRASFRLVVLAFSAAITFSTTPASAQDQPDRSRVELAVGSTVTVATRNGRVQSGRLVMTGATGIILAGGSNPRQIAWTDISEIRRGPRRVVGKSTVIGLGAGLGFAVAALGTGGCSEEGSTYAGECFLLSAGLGAGIGAVTGLIVTAGRPQPVIYRGDRQRGLSIAPMLSKHRAGVAGTIRW